jgi:hypothetical protein
VIQAAVHCPTTADLPAQRSEQPLAAGFVTVWVLRCSHEERAVPGQGRWVFRIEERADTDAAALVAALRRPDVPTPPAAICADVGFVVPYFALVDASGTAVRPRVPRGACGQPQRQVLDAVLEYIRRGWYDSAVYAELDGCRLVLRPDHTLGQLDPATEALLTTLSHR